MALRTTIKNIWVNRINRIGLSPVSQLTSIPLPELNQLFPPSVVLIIPGPVGELKLKAT